MDKISNQSNNIDSIDTIQKTENKLIQKIDIDYKPAKLSRRIFARITDGFIMMIVFLLSFVSIKAIYESTSCYKQVVQKMTNIRLESGLYSTKDEQVLNVVTIAYQDKKMSNGQKKTYLEKALNNFLSYIKEESEESYDKVLKDLNAFKLKDTLVFENKPLFIKNDNGSIIENPEGINAVVYVDKFYAPFIDTNCNGFLVTEIPSYYEGTKYLSNLLLYLNLPLSFVVSSLLVYFVPPLLFRRGRKTLGMFFYNIGFVNKECMNLSFKQWLAKFAVFYFLELLLSIFTFAIPLLISSTLMVASKSKQNFNEYMLKIREVDTSTGKIYLNKGEILKEYVKNIPIVPDFRLR